MLSQHGRINAPTSARHVLVDGPVACAAVCDATCSDHGAAEVPFIAHGDEDNALPWRLCEFVESLYDDIVNSLWSFHFSLLADQRREIAKLIDLQIHPLEAPSYLLPY